MKIKLLVALLFYALISLGQSNNLQKLDNVLSDYEQKNQLMGSFSFAEKDEIIYARAIGFADVEKDKKANTLTKYRIGSISKTFTAVLILQLVDEGKLNLQDPLSSFFPDWPNADRITIEHLIRHESGIYNFGKSTDKSYQNFDVNSRADALKAFETAPVAFEPGSKYDYNNANYVALSFIVEEIDQGNFATVLENRICKTMGLTNTFAGGPIEKKNNEAASYHWKKGWVENTDYYNSTLLGAGSIVSTPNDLNQFYTALFTGKIISAESLAKMTSFKEGVGLGLNEFPFYNQMCMGHSGSIDSFQSFSAYFPNSQTSFNLCLNGSKKDLNEILISCLRAYFGM